MQSRRWAWCPTVHRILDFEPYLLLVELLRGLVGRVAKTTKIVCANSHMMQGSDPTSLFVCESKGR